MLLQYPSIPASSQGQFLLAALKVISSVTEPQHVCLSISIHSSAEVACRIRTAPLNQALQIKIVTPFS